MPSTGARRAASARSSSSTRSIASTRRSRTRCCRPSRTGSSLVGATTENPFFEVNLRSCRAAAYTSCTRSRTRTCSSCCAARSRTSAAYRTRPAKDDALEFAARAGGDARMALSALELAARPSGPMATVTLAVAEDALQRRAVLYDKQGDKHYDLISAWIKSTRGSDPDASLLYLAGMLEERGPALHRAPHGHPRERGHRQRRSAALQVAVAAAHAVEHVGLPEAALNLAQAAVYLALAPKSNASYEAIGRAREWVREHGADPAARSPERRLCGREEAGPRRRLRLPARAPRGGGGSGADARRGDRRSLPRAFRARRGGRAARAARPHSQKRGRDEPA